MSCYSFCILLAADQTEHFIFSFIKFVFIFLLLILFYHFFIKPKIYKKNSSWEKENSAATDQLAGIQIGLLRNKKIKPSLIKLMVKNRGNREVDLDAPVLIFRSWGTQRNFRIKSVEFSEIYPMILEGGKMSVVNIDLEQFYRVAPDLKRAIRLNVEIKVNERRFRSRTLRLKWF